MSGTPPTSGIWVWPNRLLSADDLRRHWAGQRELVLKPRTIVTPLAADELRARGVRIRFEADAGTTVVHAAWLCAQEQPDAVVDAALSALRREGVELSSVAFESARRFAEAIAPGTSGGVLFCGDPATACCVANKIAGIRAANIGSPAAVAKIRRNLAANLYAVETPGRTFFEIRQLVKAIVSGSTGCPEPIATLLRELDGHAHR